MMTAQLGQTRLNMDAATMDWLAMYNRNQFRERMRKTSKNGSKALQDSTNTVNNRPLQNILQPNKKPRLSPQKLRPSFSVNDENNNVNANMGVVKPVDNILPIKRNHPSIPVAIPMQDSQELRIVKAAARSLLNLSFANGFNTPFPWNKVAPTATVTAENSEKDILTDPKPLQQTAKVVSNADTTKTEEDSTKPVESIDENNFLDTEEYRRRAQELLFQTSDILLGERKDAFFELVKRLCPYITIQRSGSRTLRTYLVDTRKKKRYRTYSDAIKGGALDPLLIETGTTVLLRGCVEEAKKRFALLLEEQRQQQSNCPARVQTA